jgi:hypothetical protein
MVGKRPCRQCKEDISGFSITCDTCNRCVTNGHKCSCGVSRNHIPVDIATERLMPVHNITESIEARDSADVYKNTRRNQIRELIRKKGGMTREEIEDATGLSHQHVTQLLSGMEDDLEIHRSTKILRKTKFNKDSGVYFIGKDPRKIQTIVVTCGRCKGTGKMTKKVFEDTYEKCDA